MRSAGTTLGRPWSSRCGCSAKCWTPAWEREEDAVSYDDLLDLYGLDDVGTLGQALKETVISGSKREVVTETKNAEATQGDGRERTALRG